MPGAHAQFQEAIRLNPLNVDYMGQLALYLEKTDKKRSEELLRAAGRWDPVNPRPLRALGNMLLDRGNRQQGLEKIKAALAIEPQKTKEYLSLLVFYKKWPLTHNFLINFLPTAG